jgi:hypothetical protein
VALDVGWRESRSAAARQITQPFGDGVGRFVPTKSRRVRRGAELCATPSAPALSLSINGNNHITSAGFSYDSGGQHDQRRAAQLRLGRGRAAGDGGWGSTRSLTYNASCKTAEFASNNGNCSGSAFCYETVSNAAGQGVAAWDRVQGSWVNASIRRGDGWWAQYPTGTTYFRHPNALGSTAMLTLHDGTQV